MMPSIYPSMDHDDVTVVRLALGYARVVTGDGLVFAQTGEYETASSGELAGMTPAQARHLSTVLRAAADDADREALREEAEIAAELQHGR